MSSTHKWKTRILKQSSSPRMHFKPHSILRNPPWTIQIGGGGCFDWFPLWATIKIYCPVWTTSNLPLTGLSCSVSSTDHGVLRGPICDIDSWLWSVMPLLDHVGSDLCCSMEVISTLEEHTLQPHDDKYFLSLSLCIYITSYLFNHLLKVWFGCFYHSFFFRYIRSERSIILLNFCLSIICSNILILVGQTQTQNVVSVI